MNDPVFPVYAHALTTLTPLYLNLVVSDAETAEALLEHEEGRPRSQFALTALKVGVLALRAARGTVDAAAVRGESERLLALLGERLEKHRVPTTSIHARGISAIGWPVWWPKMASSPASSSAR